MKTILAYGDSNTWGAVPLRDLAVVERYPAAKRWTGVAEARLGGRYRLIAEGLNGRTTCLDDPVEGKHRNGETYLLPCLLSHMPVDLVVIMLGTNDLKARFSLPASDIVAGMGRLIRLVGQSGAGPKWGAPEVLLVCPAPLATLSLLTEMFEGGAAKSKRLAPLAAAMAEKLGAHFLDAGSVIRSSEVDGIHLDEDAQGALGEAIATRIAGILAR